MDLVTTLRRQKNTIDNIIETIICGKVDDGVKRLRTLRADINYDLNIEIAKNKFVERVDEIVK